MGVHTKALARRDVVIVKNSEITIAHVLGIIVVAKGKAVPCIEPVVIDVAAFLGSAEGDLGG